MWWCSTLGLPDIDGVAMCRRIRSWSTVPIIVLSATVAEARKVAALDEGADDYVTKPFSMAELEARIRAALRHRVVPDAETPPELVFEPLVVDLVHRSATLAGGALRLTAKEFDLLAFLTRHAGRVCTHEMILKGVWGESFGRERQYLHAYVHRLRQKLAGSSGLSIGTVPGIGYSLARRRRRRRRRRHRRLRRRRRGWRVTVPVDSDSSELVEAAGHFRIYLGAAAGVGKTYAMLSEGRRRHERGTDVVVGFVESHGRVHTEAMTEGLEVVPRKVVTYRGTQFEEMDLGAVIRRAPRVALVDELAHSNVPGSGAHAKRWEDVIDLLAAGIDVISTVNIQHLESIADAVEEMTGTTVRERVPDWVVRRADQIELVDSSPEQLRRRMVHGNIYAPDKVPQALTHFFRADNLTALREIALRFLADETEEELIEHLRRRNRRGPVGDQGAHPRRRDGRAGGGCHQCCHAARMDDAASELVSCTWSM